MAERLHLVRLHVEVETNKRTEIHDSAHESLDDAGAAFGAFLGTTQAELNPTEDLDEQLRCGRCGTVIDVAEQHLVIDRNIESRSGSTMIVHDAAILAALCPPCARVTTFQLVDLATSGPVDPPPAAEQPLADIDADRYRWGTRA